MLLAGFFQFQGIGERMQSELDARQELRNLETLIRRDLSQAVYLASYASPIENQVRPSGIQAVNLTEEGQPRDHLSLHVSGRGRFYTGFRRALNPELFEVAYRFRRDAEGQLGFYRREGYYLDGPLDEGEEAIEHRLSKRLQVLDLTFFDAQGEAQESWASSTEAALPLGVNVRLGLEDAPGHLLESSFTLNLRPVMGPGVKWGEQ